MRNQGDLWDSGKVNADRSIQVPYGGKPLSSGELVWWKVRVWDNDGTPSAWSGLAHWSMGLLAASDWKGKWIGLDGGEEKPQELAGAQWIGARELRARNHLSPPHLRSLERIIPSRTRSLCWWVPAQRRSPSMAAHARKSEGAKDPFSTGYHRFCAHRARTVVALSVTSTGNEPRRADWRHRADLADGKRVMLRTGEEWRVSSTEAPDWNKASFNDSIVGSSQSPGPLRHGAVGRSGGRAWRTVLPARLLRKDFTAPAQVKRATLYVSGLGLFEAYLNGEKVGQRCVGARPERI